MKPAAIAAALCLLLLARASSAADSDDGLQAMLIACDQSQQQWTVAEQDGGLVALQLHKGFSDEKCLDIHDW